MDNNKHEILKASCLHYPHCTSNNKCNGYPLGKIVGGYAGDIIIMPSHCVAGRKTVIVRPNLLLKGKRAFSRNGFWYFIVAGIRTCYNLGIKKLIDIPYYKLLRLGKPRTFTFRGKEYPYFYHHYSSTWGNERSIEVPIISDIVEKYQGKNILEVGNVLNHYFDDCQHDVLDKYEEANNRIIHKDAAYFQPSKRYDLIVSISTFEHIGWDESPREPKRVLYVIDNLIKCLNPNGLMVATFPFGYHPILDNLLNEGNHFTEQFYLKRVSTLKWVQVNQDECFKIKRSNPSRIIVVGIVKKGRRR